MALYFFIFFLICITVQLAYFIIFIVGLYQHKSRHKTNEEPVSIIIAARNEAYNLKKLLPKLYSQTHPDFEIVVINDQSFDETYDFLKEEATHHEKLKVVTVEDVPDHVNSKKYALTLGIKAAKNDLLLLTDADCVPTADQWVEVMANGAIDQQFVLGISNYAKKPGLLNYFIRFETILTAIQYVSLALLGKPYMSVGRNMAYRKEPFLAHKGFNGFMNITGGDDDLLVNKYANGKNTAIVVEDNAQTVSLPKETWKAFLRQKLRHMAVGKQYKTVDKIILAVFSLSYIFSWLLLPVVLINHIELYFVIGSFLFRTLFMYLMFFLSTKKLNVTFNVWGLVFLDLIYFFFYIYTGFLALFTKRITWS